MEADDDLDRGGEGNSSAGGLGTWIPNGERDTSNLERSETTGRRYLSAGLRHFDSSVAGHTRPQDANWPECVNLRRNYQSEKMLRR